MDACHYASESANEWLYRSDALIWRQTYPGHGSHIRAARKLPAALLHRSVLLEDAEWIAGELISNAIKYTRSGQRGGWFGVEVGLSHRTAWIAVRDGGGSSVPIPIAPSTTDEPALGGRGLYTVAKLVSRLKIRGTPGSGHTVSAVFDLVGGPDRRARDVLQ